MFILLQIIEWLFILAAFGSALAAFVLTAGIAQQTAYLAGACFLGIMARLTQASLHHRDWQAAQAHKGS